MGVDTLRLLDRIVGLPLCWFLTLVRRLGRLILPTKPLPPPRKVLIIKLSEMGSTVLAYPAMEDLKKQIPGVELFFLVFKNNAAIVDVLGVMPAAHIITVDYGSPFRLLASGLHAMKRLLNEHIDTTIDMDFFSRLTALIAFLLCRGNRVGFHSYNDEGLYRGNLLTHRVTYSPHIHTSVAFMTLVKSLFESPDDEPHYRGRIDPAALTIPLYHPDRNEVSSIWNKLIAAGLQQNRNTAIILINPNSSDIFPLRKWPLEFFTQLCQRLLTEVPHGCLVITGVASEHKDAQFIRDRVQDPRCIDFTGQTTFRELLALYGIASLMITNDSGPAHFAALLSLPTIVLFGPETPRLYSPMGARHKAMYADFACSPCVSVYNSKKSPCTDNRCLQAISPENVLHEALTMLHSVTNENKAIGSA
ncbi:MAG: glycosyltransferase family 9 protein [Alphaproteobacteria bacterium]